jgi:two-component system, chemotaxis family, sensor kinase Cph1
MSTGPSTPSRAGRVGVMTLAILLAPTLLAVAVLAWVALAVAPRGPAMPATHRASHAESCPHCAAEGSPGPAPSLDVTVVAADSGAGVRLLLDTSDFPPRWYCGTWTAAHGWTHIVSDTLIFGAYAAIPLALAFFIFKRKDAPFPRIFWLFCAFIFACGTGHLIEATLFWQPWYRLSGLMKVATALVSWATVLALIPILPQALALPGLAKVNADLQREIAVRKKAEQAAEESNRQLQHRHDEMQQFIYTVSHDLKAPLVTTLGFVGMLKNELKDGSAEAMDAVDRVERAAGRMARTIDELLELTRIGRLDEEPERVDPADLIRELVEELAVQLTACGAVVDIRPDMPAVVVVRRQLRQVFENLLTNAIHYGCDGEHNRIEVGAEQDTQQVRFYVRDLGPGIAPQYHDKIFGLFQRLHNDDRGTGVGLAIVRRIAQLHGGQAWVQSVPGHGATFWFSVPAQFAC